MDPGYFIHDGYDGWSYGTPANPQPVTHETAIALMEIAGLRPRDTIMWLPVAQFAETGDVLYEVTGRNRFLAYGDAAKCACLDGYEVPAPVDLTDALARFVDRPSP